MVATPRSPAADRNLLFGILALQMDFIGRDALVHAMHAWVLDKGKPLGQILVERVALRDDTRVLLDALVEKHLEIHSNDPEKSLASVSSLGPVSDDLRQIADADLHVSLAAVPTTRPPDSTTSVVRDDSPWPATRPPGESSPATRGDSITDGWSVETNPFATGSPSMRTPISSVHRFHILRSYAKGGLGEVFIAGDEELGREVALKEIQNRYADDPDCRARFLLEAKITGRLEHPGIVPVYGLGTYHDGRPFYAMRLIRGDNFQDVIRRFHEPERISRDPRERALELRQLLGRFVAVCNAIAYAHSRGVLHRDLKPDNIMHGQYGETLVVDWGLAKDFGQTDAVNGPVLEPFDPTSASECAGTRIGSVLGTPHYMSPEQAAGRVHQLGPLCDIYSLGAVLYCLLTGRAPFDGADISAILSKVREGTFPEPRVVNPAVPPNLESICLKAMALSPEDRYPSALALAEAIERWLADEPLSGYRDRVFTVSTDGRFTSLSPSFEARYGWSRAEWLGKQFAPIIHPDDLPLSMSMYQMALQGKTPPAFTVRLLTKSGQYMTDEVTCILQVAEGKVVGILGLSRDL